MPLFCKLTRLPMGAGGRLGAVLIMGMVKKRCSRAGGRVNGDVNRCRYSLSAKANFFKIGIKVAPSDSI